MRRLHRYHLLVADDDDALRETLCALCEPYFDVVAARDGGEALEQARSLAIDVALCDLHMPGFTGLDVLGVFKQDRSRRPGILMTARCSPEIRDQARLIQVDCVLEKPFSRRTLLTTVASVVACAFDDRQFGESLLRDCYSRWSDD